MGRTACGTLAALLTFLLWARPVSAQQAGGGAAGLRAAPQLPRPEHLRRAEGPPPAPAVGAPRPAGQDLLRGRLRAERKSAVAAAKKVRGLTPLQRKEVLATIRAGYAAGLRSLEASPDAVRSLERVADEVVALLRPETFRAVADCYANWYEDPRP